MLYKTNAQIRMQKNLPNQLTILRLILAGIFFLVLNQYRYAGPNSAPSVLLCSAFILFILAAVTDALDGYLARRWHVESYFGRIMDPVCDKILIIGSFIYLAGPRFVMPEHVEANNFFNMVSGVYPWMVVIILLRELLVTAIRSEMEAIGIRFGAKFFGKLKMTLQSITIPIVLFVIYLDPTTHTWAAYIRDVFIYATVIVTLASGFPYLLAAIKAMEHNDKTTA